MDYDNLESLLYDDNVPQHPIRLNIYKKFFKLISTYVSYNDKFPFSLSDIQKFAINIEKGIFNYTLSIKQCDTWTEMFKTLYINRCVTIYSNLNPDSYIKNVNLINRLLNKEFNPEELPFFNSQQLFPEKYNENIIKYKSLQPKNEKVSSIEDLPDGMHKCTNCLKQDKPCYKTSYYQLQTRSAKLIGRKSTLLITSWLCYWENSCSPSLILKC